MQTWKGLWVVLLGCACSSTPDRAEMIDDSGVDAGSPTATICGAFFDAQLRCPMPRLAFLGYAYGWNVDLASQPESQRDRLRARFEAHCEAWLALPGSGFTLESLSACTEALEERGCTPCTFEGTLEPGEPCVLDEQCADGGECYGSASCDGGNTTQCGTCRALAKVGEACDERCEDNPACAPGGICYDEDHCVAADNFDGKESCTGDLYYCPPGMICEGNDCVPINEPANINEDCSLSTPCKAPLICASSMMSTAGTCTMPPPAPVLKEPGELCDEARGSSCRVGQCVGPNPPDTSMRCPDVLEDGEPCIKDSATALCDSLSACVNGKCRLAAYPSCEANDED